MVRIRKTSFDLLTSDYTTTRSFRILKPGCQLLAELVKVVILATQVEVESNCINFCGMSNLIQMEVEREWSEKYSSK